MELTPSQKETVRHQFDSYCKKILREEAFDCRRRLAKKYAEEMPLSTISELWYVLDENLFDCTFFCIQGYAIEVHNDRLAQSISSLPEKKRSIILLSYFLDMNDREISERLKIVRRTVHYMRKSSLKEMRQEMEAKDGKQRKKES